MRPPRALCSGRRDALCVAVLSAVTTKIGLVNPGAADPFLAVESWDDSTAQQWADVLELRATNPSQIQLRADLIAAARLRPGDTVVEVGCGTGITLAELAAAVGPAGRALGFEPQPVFARLARQRLTDRRLSQ